MSSRLQLVVSFASLREGQSFCSPGGGVFLVPCPLWWGGYVPPPENIGPEWGIPLLLTPSGGHHTYDRQAGVQLLLCWFQATLFDDKGSRLDSLYVTADQVVQFFFLLRLPLPSSDVSIL